MVRSRTGADEEGDAYLVYLGDRLLGVFVLVPDQEYSEDDLRINLADAIRCEQVEVASSELAAMLDERTAGVD